MICPTCQRQSAPLHYSHQEPEGLHRDILVCPSLHFFAVMPGTDLRTLEPDQLVPHGFLTGQATIVPVVFPNFDTEAHVRGDLLTIEQHVEKHCAPPPAKTPTPVEPGMQGTV